MPNILNLLICACLISLNTSQNGRKWWKHGRQIVHRFSPMLTLLPNVSDQLTQMAIMTERFIMLNTIATKMH